MPAEISPVWGLGLLAAGCAAVGVVFVWTRRALGPELAPGPWGYFSVALLLGLCAYLLGASAGIFQACSTDQPGVDCGRYGVLATGPLVGGGLLLLFAVYEAVRVLRGRRR